MSLLRTTDSKVPDEYAHALWDYLSDVGPPSVADFMLVLGSHDTRVADRAAELYNQRFAEWFIVTGGYGKVTKGLWNVPEAVHFADIAARLGVPRERIIVEPTATNTGDNIARVRDLVSTHLEIPHRTGLIVTKPYMTRRSIATARKQWPSVQWFAAAPQLAYDDYPDEFVPKTRMINLLVGDLQRMKIYADQGFQEKQDIPRSVWDAYEQLVKLGFDDFVIKE